MSDNKSHRFLSGAAMLVGAMAVVKIIGMVFKLPLTALLGGDGMGYFSTAYSLFNPIAAIAITGLPAAIAKVVAENSAKGNFINIKRILRASFLLVFALGVVGTILIATLSGVFTSAVGNPTARLSVIAIAPAMFFSCITSVYRGYYEGLSDMRPAAVSQVVEAVFKLLCGYILAVMTLNFGLNQFETTGMCFGVSVGSMTEARAVSLPFAAAASILGVSLSTFFGCIYLLLRHKIKGDGIKKEMLEISPAPLGYRVLIKRLIAVGVPVSLGALVTNLTTLIDVSSLMQRISEAIETDPQVILGMYEGLIPDTVVYTQNIPNYLYGVYSSMAITIYNLVPAITSGVGISAIPLITESFTRKDIEGTKKNILSVLRITALFSIPAGLGLSFMSRNILSVLFSSKPMETSIASPLLSMMGITAIFTALCVPIYNVLQAVGKERVPVFLMLIGGAIKLSVNFMLASIPSVNIMGAPIGSLCCYGFIFLSSVIILKKALGLKIPIGKTFLKPLLCGLICGISAYISAIILGGVLPSGRLYEMLILVVSIAIGVLFYVILLFITKSIDKNDIFLLPNGKNILKTLEKFKII